jgi:cyclohexyl-isocyanide hydratase
MPDVKTHIGFLLFPQLTQLDLTGPFEVFARLPNSAVHLVWKTLDPVESDTGLRLLPTDTFEACPALDVLCVPGGPGVNDLLEDDRVLEFLRRHGSRAQYVTSVCSGALVLGAAGLLDGYRAATHWASMEFLAPFGATPDNARVCIDRNRMSGGGVTAGIDLGLRLAAEIAGRPTAERIQLHMEYNPDPPFRSGHPDVASPEIVGAFHERGTAILEARRAAVARSAAKLAGRTVRGRSG